jgi:hypothetical protein
VLLDEGLRHRMREQGMARAGLLTWESAAQRVVTLFDEL